MRSLVTIFFLLFSSVSNSQSLEVCGDNIDNDGDGFTDCQDSDCYNPFFTNNALGFSHSNSVVLGDLDGDGDLDAFIANGMTIGMPNKVLINDGVGAYIDSGQLLGGNWSTDVALGDLDGDGDLDAYVVTYNQPGRIWINDGQGNFAENGQVGVVGGGRKSVALGDLDGDGDLDSLVALSGQNRIFLNNGQGVFADSGQDLGSDGSRDVALGDLDNDGDLDAWVTNWNEFDRILFNDGSGIFQDSGQQLEVDRSDAVAFGDMDNDGDLDAWVSNDDPNTPSRLWLNDGVGLFIDSGQEFTHSYSYHRDVGIGDLDGDGDLDVWVANGQVYGNRVWINQGGIQGGFVGDFLSSGQIIGNSYSEAVSLGDIDGDGDLDAFVANGNSTASGYPSNRVWINNGTGQFEDRYPALGSSSSGNVALADFDNDGDLDAWVVNGFSSNGIDQIWENQGGDQGGYQGDFAPGQDFGYGYSYDIAVGDLDGDGDIDAMTASRVGSNRTWINQGGEQGGQLGLFSPGAILAGPDCRSIALGDLDGDGDLDAWFANGFNLGAPNQIWINQGGAQGGDQGAFLDSGQELGNFVSSNVSLGDLDGDGDLDAWVANLESQPNTVWFNDGLGNFTDSGQLLGNNISKAVGLGDVDNDGDLDAWVANSANQPNRIWVNQGGLQGGIAGDFSDSGQGFGSVYSYDVALGDLDGDGDLDAWVANYFNQQYVNRVWINQGGVQGGTLGVYLDNGQGIGYSSSRAVSLGDLDGDGDLDAWVANGGPNRVFFNLVSCFNDEDADGIPNECDIDFTLGPDCDINGVDDTCQSDSDSDGLIDNCDADIDGDGILNECDIDEGGVDCNANGIRDTCEIAEGLLADCDFNQVPDVCDISSGLSQDCNLNNIPDNCEILAGSAFDCDQDGVLDECKSGVSFDCNFNGIPDECELLNGAALDCNANGSLDECDLANGYEFDCDLNGLLDVCDISEGAADCDLDGVPDSCQVDSDSDGTIDPCDDDLDGDGIPNSCDVDQTAGADCDLNGQDDSCQDDLDSDGIIDPCDDDIDGDGIPNGCDLDLTSGADCDQDGQDDSCQPDGDADGEIDPCDPDLDNDGILNSCDPDHSLGEDCNSNGILDSCDISGGAEDNDSNGIPDECEETLFIRGDVNGDSGIDISDAITVLGYLFTGGNIDCEKAADSNDDGAVNVADGIQILGYLFSGTGDPPAPFPDCGVDPTNGSLTCEAFGACP